MPNRRWALTLLLLAVVLVMSNAGASGAGASTAGSAGGATASTGRLTRSAVAGFSAYEWRPIDTTPLAELTAGLAAFRAMGGTSIALDISAVVPLTDVKDPTARSTRRIAFDTKVSRYLAAARAAGLSVEALAGDPAWINPSRRTVTQAIISYAAQFNARTAGPGFTGVQFDLEPWATKAWATEATTLTTQWLATVASIASHQTSFPAAMRLPITVVVPFWLDGQASPTSLRLAGVTSSPVGHIVRLLDNRSGRLNAISVMAYRDRVAGPNGSKALSATEVALTDSTGGRVRTIIAQEVGDVDPAGITFWQEGRVAMLAALRDLRAGYAARPSFGGFAVNDLRSLLLLS